MSNLQMNADDVTIVTTRRVACDGGGGALGHPKTWLDMGQDNQVRCKYCDRVFALAADAVDVGHH
ncbi:zinc-finger domain-containing protein [Hellea balneolensis]|uniref:zinc-finger domain-containing protein n=1 Tax=Hellea balneolensis TaxID=287478 RepID=UPI0003FF9A3D|nr:zinc-finger domain-containing protein [Hellea balneolensis]